jgi:hypothetical protein
MRNAAKIGGTVKKKYNNGGGTTPDPNKYKMHKTGVFGKEKFKDISKEKFDRINNRLSSNTNNNRLGSVSTAAQQVVKEGIGQRRVSVSRVNPDMVKANKAKNSRLAMPAPSSPKPAPKKPMKPTGYSKGGMVKKKMAKGGVITSPIQTRQGNRPDAGSFMAKGGQKFPDLNRDGKRTFADVLKGRGVYGKKKKKYGMGGGPGDGDPVVVPPAAAPVPTPAPAPASPGFYDLAMQTAQASPRGARVALRNARKMEEAKATGTRKGANFGTGAAGIGAALTGAGNLVNAVTPGPSINVTPPPAGGMSGMKKGGQKRPGFKAVQSKIAAKSGVSKKAAGAILASSTRKASAKAKAANPRLKRVKR